MNYSLVSVGTGTAFVVSMLLYATQYVRNNTHIPKSKTEIWTMTDEDPKLPCDKNHIVFLDIETLQEGTVNIKESNTNRTR